MYSSPDLLSRVVLDLPLNPHMLHMPLNPHIITFWTFSGMFFFDLLSRVVLDLPLNPPTSLEGDQFQALAAEAACGLPIQQVCPLLHFFHVFGFFSDNRFFVILN